LILVVVGWNSFSSSAESNTASVLQFGRVVQDDVQPGGISSYLFVQEHRLFDGRLPDRLDTATQSVI